MDVSDLNSDHANIDQQSNHDFDKLKEIYNTKWIKTNLVVLSVVFFFIFTAYHGLTNIQVSMFMLYLKYAVYIILELSSLEQTTVLLYWLY